MKKFTANVVVALLSKVLLIVTAIVAQRFILKSFGSEVNGLTSSITQIIAYFTLLEAGLGTASIQALYAPLNSKDINVVNGIVSATDKQYKKIGFLFLVLTICLSFLMPIITKSSLRYFEIFIITILMGLANVINYFFIGKFNALLYADRKSYIINILDSILGVLFSILKIIVINFGGSIIIVLLIQLLSPIVRVIILYIYFRVKYPDINFRAKAENKYISKRWNVLVHQIVGMVANHTDVVILTVSSTLSMVSVYSVYNYVYSNIHTVLQSTLLTAPQASFAKMYNSDNKDKFKKLYLLFEAGVATVVFIVLTVTLLLIIPFVKLYTAGVNDINYIDSVFALLFAVSILFSTLRIPSIMMVNVTGTFKETQKGSILEAVINIVVSIPMYIIFGMRGLLIGTCVAMAYRAIDVLVYNYKKILKINLMKYVKIFIINLIFSILSIVIIHNLISYNVNGWLDWIIYAVIIFASVTLCFIIAWLIFFREYLKITFNFLKRKIK